MLAPGFCGGSLIAAKHVLSAGHCCEGQSTAAVSVGIYKHSVFSSTLGDACSEVIQAAAIHVNPGWTGNVLNGHDTCLIELVSQPSCFNNGGPYAINLDDGTYWPRFTAAPISTAIVAGWGSTVYGGGQAAQLQELSVNLYTAYQCDTFFAWGAGFESVIDSNLCAGHREFLPATPNRFQDPDSARVVPRRRCRRQRFVPRRQRRPLVRQHRVGVRPGRRRLLGQGQPAMRRW